MAKTAHPTEPAIHKIVINPDTNFPWPDVAILSPRKTRRIIPIGLKSFFFEGGEAFCDIAVCAMPFVFVFAAPTPIPPPPNPTPAVDDDVLMSDSQCSKTTERRCVAS